MVYVSPKTKVKYAVPQKTTNKNISHTQFIYNEGYTNNLNSTMPLFFCRFNNDFYHDNLYQTMGIPFSDSIKQSVIKRRAEFLAGRYCAMKSLQEHGIFHSSVKIGTHRSPIWPETIIGSISHCDSYAVAITGKSSQHFGVGIDIENIIDKDVFKNIQSQILCNDETSLICGSSEESLLLFTIAFSIKESFFKAAYPSVRYYFDFDTISLTEICINTGKLQFMLNKTLNNKLTKGLTISAQFTILPEQKIVSLVELPHF